MITVRVDFNDLARGGKVVALREWIEGPIELGDTVHAVDRYDDDLAFDAIVAEADDNGRVLYLDFSIEALASDDIDHVVYSHEPTKTPSWQYRVVERKDFGTGDSLQEVQEKYRTRNPSRARNAIEHTQHLQPEGYWLRYRGIEGDGDLSYPARVFLATIRHEGLSSDELAKWGIAFDGRPLVIACIAEDTIKSVLDQIRDDDSVVITMALRTSDGSFCSAVSGLAGAAAPRPQVQTETLAESGLSVDSTVHELMVQSGVYEKLRALGKRPATRKGQSSYPKRRPVRVLEGRSFAAA